MHTSRRDGKPVASGSGFRRTAAVLCVLAVVLAVWRFRQWHLPHFGAVRPGVLYRSGQPRAAGLPALRLYGIRTLVNLRGTGFADSRAEMAFAARHGLRFYHLPVGTTEDAIADSVRRFLAIMEDRDNWPVLVHCSRGKERAGLFSAVFRMEFDGWSNQKALYEMHRLGLEPGSMPVAEQFVVDYQPRWRTGVLAANQANGAEPEPRWQE